MNIFILFLLWLFAPTIFVVVLACILSVFLKVPKKPRGAPTWFPDESEW